MDRLDWNCDPLDVVAAWPADRPLMMLHSGRGHPRWGRRSILAEPRMLLDVTDDSVAAGDSFVNVNVTPQGQASVLIVRRVAQ